MSDARARLEEILLVDDSEADNFLHQRVIKKLGCVDRVTVCEDGQEALDYLSGSDGSPPPRPDLIFLDINMPRIDGWQFLEEYARGSGVRCPVIVMLTTSTNPDHRAQAERNDALSAFETKPLTADSLRAVLHRFFPDRGWP